jgi:hypothetical protein
MARRNLALPFLSSARARRSALRHESDAGPLAQRANATSRKRGMELAPWVAGRGFDPESVSAPPRRT